MDLCETIYAKCPDLPVFGTRVPGLFLCVHLTLTYLLQSPVPLELLVEVHGVSQANVLRDIALPIRP